MNTVGTDSNPRFFLLQEGLLDEPTLLRLFRFYLVSIHPIMPLIPYKRMPITPEDIIYMANREPHLMAAIAVVTASLESDRSLHDMLWKRVQSVFAEVAIMGADAPLEVMEGLLLLSGETNPHARYGHSLRLCRIPAKHGPWLRTWIRRPDVLDDGWNSMLPLVSDANRTDLYRLSGWDTSWVWNS